MSHSVKQLQSVIVSVIVSLIDALKLRGSSRNEAEPELDCIGVHLKALEEAASLGKQILAEKRHKTCTLNEHLKRTYLGLFLVGRDGQTLPASAVGSLVRDLHHFHFQLDRQEDWLIVRWCETHGFSQRKPLSQLLRVCPEVIDLQVDARYIAFALGEIVTINVLNPLGDIESLQARGFLT